MKLSLNQIKEFQAQNGSSEDLLAISVDQLSDKIGAQLGAIDEVIDLGKKYKGIVIVKVIECIKHPSADKLSLCKVDDGGVIEAVERDQDGYVQVVCGAPNVRQGIKAAWLPPGSVVPESYDHEPFTLEARQIRGKTSNGMLASAKELALGDSHEGILEIDLDKHAGTDFAEAYGFDNEFVIDIENKMFTHRPDCFGFIGLLRELAGVEHKRFKSPSWYSADAQAVQSDKSDLSLAFNNELPGLVPRFTASVLSTISIRSSPVWLQVSLSRLGIRPINNIVDLTNYYMLLTGQPLHAYDYDKVKSLSVGGASLVVRQPKPGEKLELLNGKTIVPKPDAIMIATDKKLIGLAGIMGGASTAVDANTKNIILECANFNMYSVRRTSMHHGLFTDAVTRFTKGQSPLQNIAILTKIVEHIKQLCGESNQRLFLDDNHVDQAILERASMFSAVIISIDFINSRLGLELKLEEATLLLSNVEFQVEVNEENLKVTAPFWRTDIEIREDVVEEIGRLYGYDKIPLNLPSRSLRPVSKNKNLEAKAIIRDRLSRLGANEVLSYSFIDGALMDKVGQNKTEAYEIANALRPDLQYYRLSLSPSLLEKIHPNLKAGFDSFALYEIGKSHNLNDIDEAGLPKQTESTAFVVAIADKMKLKSSPYYEVKNYLEELVPVSLSFKPLSHEEQLKPMNGLFENGRSSAVYISHTGELLGYIGEYKASVSRSLKLPRYCAGFEIDTIILGKLLLQPKTYQTIPRFPKVIQDITLKVLAEITYEQVYECLDQALNSSKPNNTSLELSVKDIYQDDQDIHHKHITLRLGIASYDRTLTDQQVNLLLDSVATKAQLDLQAERV
jgi:phenylalanyl-tRNA synthetase beta chain